MAANRAAVDVKPLVLDDPDTASWDDTADVVVVGFGGAGASAALEARSHGVDVLVIDRFAGGGATAYSGGIIYAGGTKFQRQGGYDDNLDEMYKYLSKEWGNSVSEPTLRRFVNTSASNVDWLESHGVPFNSTVFPDKTIYPPDGYYLYYSGNEKVAGYKEYAQPAPRGHRAVGDGFTGNVMFRKMRESAVHHGVRMLTHAPVTTLVTDRKGDVIGVEVNALPPSAHEEHDRLYAKVDPFKPFNGDRAEKAIVECRKLEQSQGERRLIRARKGVVLSTGGYGYNLPMLRKKNPFFGQNYRALMRIGSMGCDGSGIELGEAVGGATSMMDNFFAGKSIAPPNALLRGVAVNARGERFINEETYSGFLGDAISKQPGGNAWVILDAATFRRAFRQTFSGGMSMFKNFGLPALMNIVLGGTRRASSLAALAKKCGIDPRRLELTIGEYNAGAVSSNDRYNKSSVNLAPLEPGTYYAVNISVTSKYGFTLFFTLGGLAVDDDTGLVKREDGTSIGGLYAAGRAAAGLCATNYISGTSIADCVFSGRRAGIHAAIGDIPTAG